MSAEVLECCYGSVVQHRGKGRCAADQGGRTMEVKLGNFARTDETYNLDGTDIPVFEFDPDLIGMNCVNMIDCMASTDVCGEQLLPVGVGVTHIRFVDPYCDRGRVLLALSDATGPLEEAPDGLELWLRFYGN